MRSDSEIRGVDDTSPQASAPGPFVVLAVCWIAGVLAGRFPVAAWQWLAMASAPAMLMLLMVFRRRPKAARHWALIAIVALSAAWSAARMRQVGVDDNRPMTPAGDTDPQVYRDACLTDTTLAAADTNYPRRRAGRDRSERGRRACEESA